MFASADGATIQAQARQLPTPNIVDYISLDGHRFIGELIEIKNHHIEAITLLAKRFWRIWREELYIPYIIYGSPISVH